MSQLFLDYVFLLCSLPEHHICLNHFPPSLLQLLKSSLVKSQTSFISMGNFDNINLPPNQNNFHITLQLLEKGQSFPRFLPSKVSFQARLYQKANAYCLHSEENTSQTYFVPASGNAGWWAAHLCRGDHCCRCVVSADPNWGWKDCLCQRMRCALSWLDPDYQSGS